MGVAAVATIGFLTLPPRTQKPDSETDKASLGKRNIPAAPGLEPKSPGGSNTGNANPSAEKKEGPSVPGQVGSAGLNPKSSGDLAKDASQVNPDPGSRGLKELLAANDEEARKVREKLAKDGVSLQALNSEDTPKVAAIIPYSEIDKGGYVSLVLAVPEGQVEASNNLMLRIGAPQGDTSDAIYAEDLHESIPLKKGDKVWEEYLGKLQIPQPGGGTATYDVIDLAWHPTFTAKVDGYDGNKFIEWFMGANPDNDPQELAYSIGTNPEAGVNQLPPIVLRLGEEGVRTYLDGQPVGEGSPQLSLSGRAPEEVLEATQGAQHVKGGK